MRDILDTLDISLDAALGVVDLFANYFSTCQSLDIVLKHLFT